MAYTLAEANIEAATINTEAKLRALISQLDVTSSGSVSVLYSGDMKDRTKTHTLIQTMLGSGDALRIVDNTEAAKFLNWEEN